VGFQLVVWWEIQDDEKLKERSGNGASDGIAGECLVGG
jgi:hypothetical protein